MLHNLQNQKCQADSVEHRFRNRGIRSRKLLTKAIKAALKTGRILLITGESCSGKSFVSDKIRSMSNLTIQDLDLIGSYEEKMNFTVDVGRIQTGVFDKQRMYSVDGYVGIARNLESIMNRIFELNPSREFLIIHLIRSIERLKDCWARKAIAWMSENAKFVSYPGFDSAKYAYITPAVEEKIRKVNMSQSAALELVNELNKKIQMLADSYRTQSVAYEKWYMNVNTGPDIMFAS